MLISDIILKNLNIKLNLDCEIAQNMTIGDNYT